MPKENEEQNVDNLSVRNNELLDTIREALGDIHIDDGRIESFESVCNILETSISKKILEHKIDYYTESLKV